MECGAPYVITSGVLEMQRLSVDNWIYPLQVGRYCISLITSRGTIHFRPYLPVGTIRGWEHNEVRFN